MGFASGWTPCIGVTLSAVLSSAVTAGTTAQGLVLMVAYCLGLGLPFIALAFALESARPLVRLVNQHRRAIDLASAAVLVIMGVLLLTNKLTVLSAGISQLVPFVALADPLEVEVAAPAEDQGRDALAVLAVGDQADQHPVVAPFDRVAQRADGVGGGVLLQDWTADRADGFRHRRESNLSVDLVAICLASRSRPAARMLAVKPPVLCTAGSVFDDLSMHARAIGGSRETAQKALTVRPRGRPSSPKAVNTTTPLGKLAMTSRKR